MSRTIRRKNLSKHLMYHNVWYSILNPEFSSEEEYLEYQKLRFHADGNKNYCNFNSAPTRYRNVRNRSLRRSHRNSITSIRDFDDDVELEPFVHNVGWDYW